MPRFRIVSLSAAGDFDEPTTDFVKSEVLPAIEQAAENLPRRCLIFVDELNRCQESVRHALMPALDATRRVYYPIENRFTSFPENVQCVLREKTVK